MLHSERPCYICTTTRSGATMVVASVVAHLAIGFGPPPTGLPVTVTTTSQHSWDVVTRTCPANPLPSHECDLCATSVQTEAECLSLACNDAPSATVQFSAISTDHPLPSLCGCWRDVGETGVTYMWVPVGPECTGPASWSNTVFLQEMTEHGIQNPAQYLPASVKAICASCVLTTGTTTTTVSTSTTLSSSTTTSSTTTSTSSTTTNLPRLADDDVIERDVAWMMTGCGVALLILAAAAAYGYF